MQKANRKIIHRSAASLLLCILLSAVPAQAAQAAEVRAIPTESAVMLDGRQLLCAAYNIGGSNYFKLRDLMQALGCSVEYDSASKAIIIDTSKPYIPDGSETSAKIAALPEGASYSIFPATATLSAVDVTLDGRPVYWAAYNVYGNNFFKLRDIGEAMSFSVVWDAQNDMVVLDTSKGYTPDETAAPETLAPKAPEATETGAPDLTADELKMEIVRLINIERANAGLPELKVLPALMECAQAKADDMRDNRYYGHDSPVYGTCFQMIRSFVPNAKWCTENLAPWLKTPDEAVKAWLDSPSHRNNLLDPRATHTGVGIYERGGGGYTWVQQFAQL